MGTRSKWERGLCVCVCVGWSADTALRVHAHSCMFVTSCCSVTTVTVNRWLAPRHRMTLHIMFPGQTPHTDENKGLGAECLFKAPPVSLYFKLSEKVVVEGRTRGGGVFLPNRDLICEPEHPVCEDATRHGAAPFLPAGRLAL